MDELTLTEALVKLKLVEKKIEQANQQLVAGVVTVGSNVPVGFKSQEEFKQEVKKRIDSVEGLIKFRDNLKSAIVKANATTNVTIGSKSMTIAEAIERKNSIKFRKTLVGQLANQWVQLEKAVTQQNANLEIRADQFLTGMFGNKESSQSPEEKQAERAAVRSTWLTNNRAGILTNDKVKQIVEELDKEITDFETNVDVALSVANAQTKIVVSD